jgi:UPF0271 protein
MVARSIIDINADLGEGSGNDAEIMPYISSCNIACGGHYGTDESMRETIRLAKDHQVSVGAHPSFPDTDNFGRKLLTLTKDELTETIFNQLLHFFAVCETEAMPIHHIKLHGALYNYAAIDAPTADAVVEAIIATKVRPKLYLPFNSVLHRKAENLIPLVFEAFIDRRYTNDLQLVPRAHSEAIIRSPQKAWEQLWRVVSEKKVTTIQGNELSIEASTFCIHGDHEGSVQLLKHIHSKLQEHKIKLA